MGYDFGGYATKNNLKCADGRTILAGAFKENDGVTVPLVWQHLHNDPENVLGHALLENRKDGVYAHCKFNDTEKARHAKELVRHKDISSLSIYANKLRQRGSDVLHGSIREVSLVISGANPGAYIDNITIQHGDSYEFVDDEVIIYIGDDSQLENIEHSEGNNMAENNSEETVQDVFDTLNEKQKNVVYYMIGKALEGQNEDSAEHSDYYSDDLEHSEEGGNIIVHNNIFESRDDASDKRGATLTHSQIKTIIEDAERLGSLKESFLAHADEYGIQDINILFPDAKTIRQTPDWVKRRTEWVDGVINGARHTPFSRIKSMSADITLDTARAKGYVKTNMKKEEFFKVSKRITTPTTIYKKQKLDRDDIIDITDFDVVAWLKAEMRLMLEEELGRAILIGDGREIDDPDKINEEHIRPIAYDDDFYTHKIELPANVSGDVMVESILRGRSEYKGSGNPTFYTTEKVITDMLLLKDKIGRRLYDSEAALATAMRMSKLVPAEVLETKPEIIGIMVHMPDYTIGADKGGEINFFDDFDIDFNQYKYLYETRLSGALTLPKTAVVIGRAQGTEVTPQIPTFNPVTGVVTIPNVTGVDYYSRVDILNETKLDVGPQAAISEGESIEIVAKPRADYYFPHNFDADWVFTRNA